MSVVKPNVSSSQALITPGYPLVSVEKSNPNEHALGKQEAVTVATKLTNAVKQSGHTADKSV